MTDKLKDERDARSGVESPVARSYTAPPQPEAKSAAARQGNPQQIQKAAEEPKGIGSLRDTLTAVGKGINDLLGGSEQWKAPTFETSGQPKDYEYAGGMGKGSDILSSVASNTDGKIPGHRIGPTGDTQVGLLNDQRYGDGINLGPADYGTQQDKQLSQQDEAFNKEQLPWGVSPVQGQKGIFQNIDVDESEYGKALYSNSAYGATPQGLDAAIAKGGQGAFDPQGGTFSQVGNQNQPGGTPSSNNPYGRSDETQAQIERNVAGINRQIMDNREIHELRMGQKQVTGPFSGRGGGIASEARARAIGDTGAYGKAGSGFGYGPGGVGDDGSGDFFRGKAAALLRRMPSGKAGDRSKRKEMFKQVAAYTSLANNRDGMLAKEAGNKDAKEMFSDKLEAEAGRDEQELAQQQAQFGQAMFQESDQFNRGLDQDQANADRQFGLDEYLAKNPKQKQQSLIQIPGRDVQIGDDGTVLQEGSPSYVYDPNRGTTTGFGAQGPFTPGAVDPVEAQMQAELDSIKANFAADPKKYPEELSLKLIAETRAKYGR